MWKVPEDAVSYEHKRQNVGGGNGERGMRSPSSWGLESPDLSLANGEDAPVELALQPNKPKSPTSDNSAVKLGEILFLAAFSQDRLTVIVSKIRNLAPIYKTVFVRLYIVQPMGQVTKKKTSERVLVDGGADIGESMFFSVPRSRVLKSHLRLSIVCGTDNVTKSIGHVTLGPKSSGKQGYEPE
ncbi:hypothetical protein ANCCEY_01829 [Ancylostoma ceylanicum]|uniref:Uncharacterized protein n=1 Tax=Ancylostoma ceylanicum TaxID=53326 RepID=A0A0D6M9F3_9BILA|nr:hypothetical protein ANCCEY_01829 [Ancylostoma ceylanicum]